jgi:hypothetical protein
VLNIPIWTNYQRQRCEIESLTSRLCVAEESSERRYRYRALGRKNFEEISNLTNALVNIMFLMDQVPSDPNLLNIAKEQVALLGTVVDFQDKLNHRIWNEDRALMSTADI